MKSFARRFVQCFVILPVLGLASGCGDLEDAVTTEENEISFTNVTGTTPFLYDSGTQCTAGPVSYHCCPQGMAMVGVHINHGVFKCAAVSGGLGSVQTGNVQRNGMLSCPFGMVATGYYRGGLNHTFRPFLACARPNSGPTTFEYVDGGTQDFYPMHVCTENSANPLRFAMSGIHESRNQFNCAR